MRYQEYACASLPRAGAQTMRARHMRLQVLGGTRYARGEHA